MICLLLAMYPARWRQRYGEEFRAVLESRPLGPFDVADVLIGALDARLTRFRFAGTAGTEGGLPMMLRIGGFGAIAGGAFWVAGLAASRVLGGEDPAWLMLLAVGSIGLLLALAGLSAFQARRDPVLTWAAFLIPGLGSIATTIGLLALAIGPGDEPLVLGSIPAWSLWIGGLLGTLVGSIIFAIATVRAAVFSRRAAMALAASSLVVLFFAFGLGPDAQNSTEQLLLAVGAFAFASSWIALGIQALRQGPIRVIAPA